MGPYAVAPPRSVTQRLTQRIITIVIQSDYFVLVEPLITDLHPGAEGPARAQFYDSVVDRLRRCRETPVIGVASSTPRQMQFCR